MSINITKCGRCGYSCVEGFDDTIKEMKLETITRVEVIDETGRAYSKWDCKPKFSVQDEGRTLKIFLDSDDRKEIEFKELPEEHIKLLLEAIDKYGTKCDNCEVVITEKTYGFIHADVIVCNSILCQLWAFKKIKVLE